MSTIQTDRISGAPTAGAAANDLSAIEALLDFGIIERTAQNVWVVRALTGANAAWAPQTSDAQSLGTSALMWSDVFLAAGGVVNFNAGNMTISHSPGDLTLAGGSWTVGNTGLHLLDTDASHDLIVKPGSNITADRTLTLTTGDSDRTLSLTGNLTLATTGDRTLTVTTGAADRAVTLSGDLTVSATASISGTSSGTNTGDQAVAAQADQEAAASTSLIVTPGRQQFHPSAAKCWAYITVSAGTPNSTLTSANSYNITSITDTATGQLTITIGTDFSSTSWCAVVAVERASTTLTVANLRNVAIRNGQQAAGATLVECWDDTATTALQVDPAAWHFVGFGDQ